MGNSVKSGKTKTFIDLETTGFDFYGSSVIYIAAVVDAPTLEKPDSFYYKIKPTSLKHWKEDAEKVHGISYGEAMHFDDGLTVAKDLLEKLFSYGEDQEFWYHGRNAFDLKFLRAFFFMNNYGYYDLFKIFPANKYNSTLDLAKKHLQLKSYSLNNVCDQLGIELKHHDAMSDAWGSYHIYKKLINNNLTI